MIRLSPSRRHPWCLWVILAVAVLASSGCGEETAELRVEICGDIDVPRKVDALRISLLDEERETRRAGIIDLLHCPGGRVDRLPLTTSLQPIEGTAWIVVQGLREGTVVSRRERRTQLQPDSSKKVRVALTKNCMGVLGCPLGQTCVQGKCELTPRDESDPLRCASGRSGGNMSDASSESTDAGAGRADTGASRDAGEPAGKDFDPKSLCPGYDAGSPSDAGSDLE